MSNGLNNGIYAGTVPGLANGLHNGGLNGQEQGLYTEKLGNGTALPVLVYDFTQTNFYPNSGNTIVDLSGNNNSGTFVTGTNNGTVTTVSGMNTAANGQAGYLAAAYNLSVRLPDFCKFPGRKPYTICSWVYPTSAAGGSYPGCWYSYEGRSGPAIGINFAFDFASATKGFLHYRYDGATGSAQAIGLYPTEGGIGVVNYNKWYFTAIRYDGTTMNIDVFIDGKRYNTNTPSTASILESTGWSAFGGLRYNNWLVGRVAYFSVYNRDIGIPELTKLYIRTRSKIGI